MEASNGNDQYFFPTKHVRQRHCGRREFGAFPRTNPRFREPTRARRRLDRNTRPGRTIAECIARTLDQLEVVVQIRDTPWSSVTSLSKMAGEGRLTREGRSMAKQASVVACTQKESFTLCMKQPSSGNNLCVCTLPNDVETCCDASKAQCVPIFTFGPFNTKNCARHYSYINVSVPSSFLFYVFGTLAHYQRESHNA